VCACVGKGLGCTEGAHDVRARSAFPLAFVSCECVCVIRDRERKRERVNVCMGVWVKASDAPRVRMIFVNVQHSRNRRVSPPVTVFSSSAPPRRHSRLSPASPLLYVLDVGTRVRLLLTLSSYSPSSCVREVVGTEAGSLHPVGNPPVPPNAASGPRLGADNEGRYTRSPIAGQMETKGGTHLIREGVVRIRPRLIHFSPRLASGTRGRGVNHVTFR